ncbi:MAG: hypothetical protein DCC43_14795, partial [Candidatus Brocadia sp.]
SAKEKDEDEVRNLEDGNAKTRPLYFLIFCFSLRPLRLCGETISRDGKAQNVGRPGSQETCLSTLFNSYFRGGRMDANEVSFCHVRNYFGA